MKKVLNAFFLAAVFAIAPGEIHSAGTDGLHIIPQPQKVTPGQGTFKISPSTTICADKKDVKAVAAFFASKMKDATGYEIKVTSKPEAGAIRLKIGNKRRDSESYTLKVTSEGVEAVAPTAQGLFYAMQTFLQLLPPQIESPKVVSNVEWTAPAVTIEDKPRFKYRGLLTDVCRHFQTIETIKKQLDMMAMFKLNQFHWHLTEDQGWRIEIKRYPELTKYAAFRDRGDENLINGFYKPTVDSLYGGFYTQEQVREVVAYAKERFINVIPEFELPGHEVAAISAFPWLACREEPRRPWNIWGISPIVMCPGKDTTFEFIENVLAEMVELFPGKYFHIGGDESPRSEWEKCPLCQRRAKELGLKEEKGRSIEAQLQSYVVERAEKFLNKHGKTIIGWDEILEGGNLNKSAVVMSWRGEQGGITAANAGHHVIMVPNNYAYLDYFQDRPEASPSGIGGYVPLQKVYSYNPVPKQVEEQGNAKYVLGPQGNTWSEYIVGGDKLLYRMFPRAVAIAEIGWTEMANKDSLNFFEALDNDASVRMSLHDVNFHMPIPVQEGMAYKRQAFVDEIVMPITTVRPVKVVYTTDGSEPNANSTVYTSPIRIKESCTLRLASVFPNGIIGGHNSIKMVKEPYSPAIESKNVEPGLNLHVAYGLFKKTADLADYYEWDNSITKDFGGLRIKNPKNDYSTVAEGYIMIPEDGVYGFLSENNQVIIDGKVIVDKDNDVVKRSESGGGTVALKKGLHKIKVVFIGYNGDGWPTYHNNTRVRICNTSKNENFKDVTPDMLFHEVPMFE